MDSFNTQPDFDSTDSKNILEKYLGEQNISSLLDKEEVQKIAGKVLAGFMDDKTTQTKWLMDTEDAIKLARLTKEPKNTPLPNSANIKYPMIASASEQFAARTYPELIKDGKIVKAEIFGKSSPLLDLIAQGVSEHMSHQLLGSDSEWEASMDKLINVLPNIGFVCKKTYYEAVNKKMCSDVCFYKDLILRNDPTIGCLADLRRITHVLHMHTNDLVTGCREGIYDEETVMDILNFYSQAVTNPECTLLEQHRFLDLDNDGYEEPYIVTVHQQTNKVIRIIARFTKEDVEYKDDKVLRITPTQYFTDYHFLPAPDGSFMSLGFGSLLLHLNESVNTILNQLTDAGTLSNLQTGIIDSRVKLMGGQMQVDPGTWTRAKGVIGQNIKDGFFPINYKEPSSVLYQLLGLLINAAKELTSSTDAMQGLQNATNVPATSMLAMVEQGMKLYSAIKRRMDRGLKSEFQKIYKLNGQYLDEKEYYDILGPEYRQLPNIYKIKSVKVIPISDPNMSSDAQRLAQAQVIMSIAGRPGVDNHAVYTRLLQAANVSNIEQILPKENQQQANAPDPKMIDMQAKHQTKMAEVQIKGRAQDLKEKEFTAKLSKLEAEITSLQAGAVKNIAQAQQGQQNADTNSFNSKLEAVKTKLSNLATAHAQMSEEGRQHVQLQLQAQQQAHDQGMDQQQQGLDQQAQNTNQQATDQQHLQVMNQQSLDQQSQEQANSGQDNQSNDNGVESSPNQ